MKKNRGISKFEQIFGRFAIPNLSLILVLCYVAGYAIEYINADFMQYLTLNPYQILHGQIWRVVTWIICPPEDLSIFTIVMLFFYYSIGTGLERTWGTYQYNVYIWRGILITVLSSFACLGLSYAVFGDMLSGSDAEIFFFICSFAFSTFYINMSILLAYGATYPNEYVLLMFVIPVKMKWLAIFYGVMLVYNMFTCLVAGSPIAWFELASIAASLLNFVIFWMCSRSLYYLNPKQIKRKVVFTQQVKSGEKQAGHKCSVCGRTDEDDPNLEFRYCSKCVGNHEYCQDHLFTHAHKLEE